jgi:GDP-L-fucose synthase
VKVFVAGAAGMAGSAIVERLLRDPARRVVGSYRSTPPAVDHPRVEHVRLDLLDRQALTRALAGCDAAILAASESGGIRMLAEQPWRQVGPNLALATTWLEALQAAGVRRAVVVGSATLYQPFGGRIREDQLDWNQDPSPEAFGVGWVTRTAEKLCELWQRTAGLDITRIRAANIYGPRARFDPARANVIPALVRKAADRLDPFEVWGSPEVTRDVIYSGDFGEAVARLLDAPGTGGEVFNVGSGRPVTVGDLVKAVLRASDNEEVRVVYTAAGPSSSPSRVLDCDRLYARLNWAPATTLEDGIRETWRWWLANRTTWPR